MSMSGRLEQINGFLEEPGKDYPVETGSFLDFMRKAEAGPALMCMMDVREALDEFGGAAT